MMSTRQFAALLGFLFAAAIAALSFGEAVLCLLAALAFYAAAGFFEGSLGLAEAQSRLGAARDGLRGSPAGAQRAPGARTGPVR